MIWYLKTLILHKASAIQETGRNLPLFKFKARSRNICFADGNLFKKSTKENKLMHHILPFQSETHPQRRQPVLPQSQEHLYPDESVITMNN